MKRNELQNGDIIMTGDGLLGLYLAENDVIIYQESGYDFADMSYDEDLSSTEDNPEYDIMRVYRAPRGCVISFSDYEEGDLVFERDQTWEPPVKENKKPAAESAVSRIPEPDEAALKRKAEQIRIMVQGFYGNRTMTEIHPDEFDSFMLGHLGSSLMEGEKIDRTVIRIPEAENLVLIYNKYQEKDALSDLQKFIQTLRRSEDRFNPTAVIPEAGIALYSRCIVCRMADDGKLLSLEREDISIAVKYLAQ